jgi:hypothetical protein
MNARPLKALIACYKYKPAKIQQHTPQLLDKLQVSSIITRLSAKISLQCA